MSRTLALLLGLVACHKDGAIDVIGDPDEDLAVSFEGDTVWEQDPNGHRLIVPLDVTNLRHDRPLRLDGWVFAIRTATGQTCVARSDEPFSLEARHAGTVLLVADCGGPIPEPELELHMDGLLRYALDERPRQLRVRQTVEVLG